MITFDVIEYRGRKDKETAVDETAIAPRFFDKARHPTALRLDRAVATRRENRSNGGLSAMLTVELNARADIDVAKSVTVGEAEGFVVGDVRGYSF